MDSLERGMIEAFRNREAYDYVANNYHLMSNEMLKRIALETIYELGNARDASARLNNVADELRDMWED